MNSKALVEKIKNLNYHPKTINMQLKKHHLCLYTEVIQKTDFLGASATLFERLYCLESNITTLQICPICKKNPLKFNYTTNSYRLACSTSCLNRLNSHKDHVTTALNKLRKTIDEKRKKTCLKKYGGNAPACSKNIQAKIMLTKLALYNDKNYNNREKAKLTFTKHYGVDNIFKTLELKEKSKKNRQKISYDVFVLNKNFDTVPLFSYEEYCNRKSDLDELRFKCTLCGHEYLTRHYDGKHNRCPICHPEDWNTTAKSKQEISLVKFLQSISINEIITSDRQILDGKELDIYIADKKLAIEYDGLYWHSSTKKHDDYHLSKTERCEEKGIQLIHIFEDEWLSKTDIVKSRLKNLLGIYDATVFARKCEVREVTSKESKIFQETNHIQGAVNAKVHLGLYYGNELISLMTFGKCRFNKNYEWELLRFCNKLGYHVPGAAGKLLKHFEKTYHPKSLISYADRRWSRGKLYEALGFTLDHISRPNYWYFNTNIKRESRTQFQKHKLENKLETFDITKTEFQNMTDNGYFRIFDCGNLVYEKNFT